LLRIAAGLETGHAATGFAVPCHFGHRGGVRLRRRAAASGDIARILFFVAIVIFVALLVVGLMAGNPLW
jgi:uncharacterized membrane protein YtjA (UPF0391 family)